MLPRLKFSHALNFRDNFDFNQDFKDFDPERMM